MKTQLWYKLTSCERNIHVCIHTLHTAGHVCIHMSQGLASSVGSESAAKPSLGSAPLFHHVASRLASNANHGFLYGHATYALYVPLILIGPSLEGFLYYMK